MIRFYLILALTGILLLSAAFATGMAASGFPGAEAGAWGGVHLVTSLTSLTSKFAVLAIHSIVYTYFVATMRRVKETSRAHDLPDWLSGQAERNKGRASRFIVAGVAMVAVAAWTGSAPDRRGSAYAPWHEAVASFTFGFNAVAFFIEYASVVAQQRLLAELKVQADRIRTTIGDESEADEATSSRA
jgi:membrane protein implicated in regulation of membrane protease activity